MAAYAALVSLFNDLQLIPNHLIHSFSFDDKQLSSLSQTVEFLIDFMESYDSHSHGCTREATEALESRIATAAHAAHDVIQSHVVNQILAGSTRRGKVRSYFLLDLQKAMDNMEFVKRETMQLIKARSGSKPEQPTYSSKATTSSEPLKNAMVGFDEVVLEHLEVSLVSGSEWNLDKEEFYCLKTLDIVDCRDLISLNANPANFPVLETLYLRKLPKLSAIPLDIGEIPTLRLIELKGCSTSAAVSAMIMVIEQENSGNSDLQLYVRFWEHKDLERFQEMLQEECLTSNSLHLYLANSTYMQDRKVYYEVTIN